MLLVTGPRGVGKSSLYRQLSATLEPRAKAARLNGSLVSEPLEVLGAMVQGFGLGAPADAGAQVLRQVIADHAQAQESSERFCVTLIDDAELLDPKALESLMELAARSTMRLVLFGEVRLVPALERLAEPAGVEWHEIRLTGLVPEDVARLCGVAPAHSRVIRRPAALFRSPNQVRSPGSPKDCPGASIKMARVLLARIESTGEGPARGPFLPCTRLCWLLWWRYWVACICGGSRRNPAAPDSQPGWKR